MSTVTITAQDINKLRQATGAGMMDCRKALTETSGDFEAAIDWLRKQGQKVAAKRSDRETKEGVVVAKTNSANNTGVIICISCETDFVAKNEAFVNFVNEVADAVIAGNATTIEAALALPMGDTTIQGKLDEQIAKIGEKLNLSKLEVVNSEYVISYIHGAYRIGVLVGYSKAIDDAAAKDIAMQIAAMSPVAIDADNIPADVLAREQAIVVETMKADPKMADKPEEMIQKIAAGKMGAYFKENTLLAQPFVKDGSKSVAEYLKTVDSAVKVNNMLRVQVG
jgi:elongation factor Ts